MFHFRAFKKALSSLPGASFSSSKQKATKKFGLAINYSNNYYYDH